jgi:hypothetical protein
MTARQTRFAAVTADTAAPPEWRQRAPRSREQVSMNARRFDALTVAAMTSAPRASRRKLLRGLAVLAVAGFAPGAAKAFDGGVAPVQVPASGAGCTSGADCAAGEICLNGACAPRQAVGAGSAPTSPGTATTGAPDLTDGTEVPDTVPVAPPDTTETGVGGLIQPGAPLPARIYAGRCGALGAEAAFQLIDVGSVEGVEEGENPQGALTAIPAEFSTTVVNATLADLLASEHAIDVRVDDADPATSIACGDVGGPIEAGANGNELAVGLQERGQSAYAGIAWLQDEGERTLVRVFLARGLGTGDTVTVAQSAETNAAASAPEAPEPAAVEAAQAAGTPVVEAIAPLGPGSTVLTTIDVNLRAAPADDAEVLTILGEGVELQVTGAVEDGWIPVTEPASGQAGFVSDQFVTVAT